MYTHLYEYIAVTNNNDNDNNSNNDWTSGAAEIRPSSGGTTCLTLVV